MKYGITYALCFTIGTKRDSGQGNETAQQEKVQMTAIPQQHRDLITPPPRGWNTTSGANTGPPAAQSSQPLEHRTVECQAMGSHCLSLIIKLLSFYFQK